MKTKNILFSTGSFLMAALFIVACSKSETTNNNPTLPTQTRSSSFVEEFDTVGNLTAKGWVFRNNSFPMGQSGWRQGRYEAAAGVQFKFIGPVSYYGFPAYSAKNTPNDFISCDVTASQEIYDATSGLVTTGGNISAWIISPQLSMRNGDSIYFYTRAVFDANYSVYTKDRMQVRANFTDGTANVGGGATTVGSFTTVISDINSSYANNDPGGYPRAWTKYSLRISGIPGDSVRNGRFAFRYMSADAGLQGGSAADNFPTVVGIDSLAFVHK